jgi:replicative DNA helicase
MDLEASEPGRLPASARILRADNGSEVTCEELVLSGERPLVWSLDPRERVLAQPMTNVYAAEYEEVFTLRLGSGRQMEATADSQFLTFGGWLPLRSLQIGDRVGVPRRVPKPVVTERMAEDEVILLAHMIGDGSCVRNQPIRYASVDEMSLNAVANAAKHFGVTAKRDDYPSARVTTLRLPAPYHLTHGRRNPIAAWLDGMGLFGKRSYEKFVPAAIFGTPNEQVALFLRHLWATDGCVTWDRKQRKGRIYYGSTSRQLIDDVRQLLLRFGIATRAYCAPKAGYRDYWFLNILGVGNQRRFLRDIDVHGLKFFAAREVLTNLAVAGNENVDTVPREVWDRARLQLAQQRISHREFAAAMQTKFCGSTMWKHSPSRSRLHRAAAILNDRGLHDLTNNDVFWDKIVEISSAATQNVYRVGVKGAHNVVTQGISVSTAFVEARHGVYAD